MERTVLDPRVFADFEAAARDLEMPEGAEALEALEAEFAVVAGTPGADAIDADRRARRLRDLLDALTTARSLVATFGRDDPEDRAAYLADLEQRVADLLARVRSARQRITGSGGSSPS